MIENEVGCNEGWFLQKFHFVSDSQGKTVSVNECCQVDSDMKKRSWPTYRTTPALSSTYVWLSGYKEAFSVLAQNHTALIDKQVVCGDKEYLADLEFQ